MSALTIEDLRAHALFDALDDDELRRLLPALRLERHPRGSLLFEQDDRSVELYLLRDGQLSIGRTDRGDDGFFELARLRAPAVFGELAFLDGSTRSATVIAVSDVEVLVLDPDSLDGVEGGASIHERVLYQIALMSADRLKQSNESYVESLKARLDALRLQMEFGQFFVYILACNAIGTIVNVLLHSHLQQVDVYARTFSWTYLLVLLLPSLLIVRQMHVPLSHLGMNTQQWRRSLGEGALASSVCVLLTFSVVFVAPRVGWFTPLPIGTEQLSWVPSYMLHSALQEFLARGIVQTSFQRFFADRGGWRSIILASLLFSLFHVHFGLTAVLVTFGSGLVFGRLYWRHQNLIGVSLLHGVAGSCAFLLGAL